ncbi:ABC-three component system protein [Bradyrhizobium sp. DN5]|uniref:ABC-three component system protein n=1 Tax=Bradyrhizobium sp. DN5 TaxID=3056950 RepID=UPI003523CE07
MTENANGTEESRPASGTALTIHQPSSTALTTSQTGNIVHGHMGGRDVNVYAPEGDLHITQQLPSANSRSVFRKLFDKLENEAATDRTLTTYIRQLEIYTRRVEDEKVIGLEKKLKMAGRERQVSMAVALKESVYADIKTNVFSSTYQLIVATLMSKIHERFETEIRPLIEAGLDRAHIDKVFSEQITIPISQELDDCPQFKDVAVDYVRGMTFFLTGNCHIRWD